jgi:predicted phage-related endonuclease
MNKVVTFETEKDWLDYRLHIITGSDITAIMGINPYKTIVDVWLEKTGKALPQNYSEEQLDNFERGHWFEKPLLDWFMDRTNNVYEHNKNNNIYLYSKNENIGVTPDGFVMAHHSPPLPIIEIKSTASDNIDNLRNIWYTQLLFNAGVCQSEEMFLIWIDGRHKRNYESFEFDNSLFNDLIASAEWFWDKNILADIPPDTKTSADMLKLWNKSFVGETVYADDEDIRNYLQLINIKNEAKILEKQQNELEEKLKIKIKQNEGMIDETGKVLCTWKSQERDQFLTVKFKQECPIAYKQYTEKKTIRVFLTKK